MFSNVINNNSPKYIHEPMEYEDVTSIQELNDSEWPRLNYNLLSIHNQPIKHVHQSTFKPTNVINRLRVRWDTTDIFIKNNVKSD